MMKLELPKLSSSVTSSVLAVVFVMVAICLSQQNAEAQSFLCPQVRCPPLSSTCQHREFIVLEFAYRRRGQRINVRCESCPYCLDMPARRGRARRSADDDNQGLAENVAAVRRPRSTLFDVIQPAADECPQIDCPSLTTPCQDARNTPVVLVGRRCGFCPACYDNVFDKDEVIYPTLP